MSTQSISVSASEFVTLINSDRKVQSSKCGKWFSAKDGITASDLKTKAEGYLKAYKDYIVYLNAVMAISDEELNKELTIRKYIRDVSKMSEDNKELLLKQLNS